MSEEDYGDRLAQMAEDLGAEIEWELTEEELEVLANLWAAQFAVQEQLDKIEMYNSGKI